jgi:hypothetical protein
MSNDLLTKAEAARAAAQAEERSTSTTPRTRKLAATTVRKATNRAPTRTAMAVTTKATRRARRAMANT